MGQPHPGLRPLGGGEVTHGTLKKPIPRDGRIRAGEKDQKDFMMMLIYGDDLSQCLEFQHLHCVQMCLGV